MKTKQCLKMRSIRNFWKLSETCIMRPIEDPRSERLFHLVCKNSHLRFPPVIRPRSKRRPL